MIFLSVIPAPQLRHFIDEYPLIIDKYKLPIDKSQVPGIKNEKKSTNNLLKPLL